MMKLYRPLQSNTLSQGFGENKVCIYPDGRLVLNFGKTCPIYTESVYKKYGMIAHNGQDWGCWYGEPIYHSGEFSGIMKTEVDNAGGVGVDIISKEKVFMYKGNPTYVKLRYWHLKSVVGFDGKEIKEGDLIGYGDSTGVSTGNHLHWAFKPCNASGGNVDGQNGYFGAIDQAPYFVDMFVLDAVQKKQEVFSTIDYVRKALFGIKVALDKLMGK